MASEIENMIRSLRSRIDKEYSHIVNTLHNDVHKGNRLKEYTIQDIDKNILINKNNELLNIIKDKHNEINILQMQLEDKDKHIEECIQQYDILKSEYEKIQEIIRNNIVKPT